MALKNEKIIARVPRDESQELMILTGEYWNMNVVDIRWWRNGKPSSKGIRINENELKTLKQALEMIEIGIETRNKN